MRGESPVQSRLCVDVRDIAKAHVAVGTMDSTNGKRYIVSAERRLTSHETAKALRKVSLAPEKIYSDDEFDGGAIKIGDQEVEAIERLKSEIGLTLRPVAETFEDMARALLEQQAEEATI